MKNKMTTNGILLYALKKTYPDAEIVAVDSSNKKGEEMDKIFGKPYVLSIKNKTKNVELLHEIYNKNIKVKFTHDMFAMVPFFNNLCFIENIERIQMEILCNENNLHLQLSEPLEVIYRDDKGRIITTVVSGWCKKLNYEENTYTCDVRIKNISFISMRVHPKTKIYLTFYPKAVIDYPTKRKT